VKERAIPLMSALTHGLLPTCRGLVLCRSRHARMVTPRWVPGIPQWGIEIRQVPAWCATASRSRARSPLTKRPVIAVAWLRISHRETRKRVSLSTALLRGANRLPRC
jgi:hypothetical protein